MPLKNNTRFCGSKTRQNQHNPCMQPSMKNGRCRLHGGKSTGPKTIIGKLKSANANYRHGFYTKEAVAERKQVREMIQWRHDLDEYIT